MYDMYQKHFSSVRHHGTINEVVRGERAVGLHVNDFVNGVLCSRPLPSETWSADDGIQHLVDIFKQKYVNKAYIVRATCGTQKLGHGC